jgi:hypothetical protein
MLILLLAVLLADSPVRDAVSSLTIVPAAWAFLRSAAGSSNVGFNTVLYCCRMPLVSGAFSLNLRSPPRSVN